MCQAPRATLTPREGASKNEGFWHTGVACPEAAFGRLPLNACACGAVEQRTPFLGRAVGSCACRLGGGVAVPAVDRWPVSVSRTIGLPCWHAPRADHWPVTISLDEKACRCSGSP